MSAFGEVFTRGEGTARVEAFSDGVFAIAITLLVLNLQVPELPPEAPPPDVMQVLLDSIPKLRAYVLSFLVVGLFWVNHQRMFNHIVRHDTVLLWLNLLLLMFVSFIPFPMGLVGRYATGDVMRLYAANLTCVGLAQLGLWAYASVGQRLIGPEVGPVLARYVTLRALAASSIFAASFAVTYWDPDLAMLSWVLLPVTFALLGRAYPVERREDEVERTARR